MKHILIIQGHPGKPSLCSALEEAYLDGCGARSSVKSIHLRDLAFDPILRERDGNSQRLEPDLVEAQTQIKQADHIVLFYPTWWGSVPALLKGFVDRVFLPDFAFSYRPDSLGWDKLLSGKTARIVSTMDAPSWYDRFVYGRSAMKQIEKATFAFCGIRTVGRHVHAMVRKSSPKTRETWIAAMKQLGKEDAC